MTNKRKIINDPVYGFINIKHDIVFDIMSHVVFQRLRNIKQCALTCMVYPGAMHTRFQHALGATHLMNIAISTLKSKGVEISSEEEEALNIAILLHDIGHGPFSHALESCIIENVSHEDISKMIMKQLNNEFGGRLSLAIDIFENKYERKFLHQLVSSQLDVDRMDYLNRDSFFSGVSEGVVNFDRILKLLNEKNDKIVVDEKGLYSIEKFIIARRLMYWQVYFHKTVVVAENILTRILKRAKELTSMGEKLFATPTFDYFLNNNISKTHFENDPECLKMFLELDDNDIYLSIKHWSKHKDTVLSVLCLALVDRKMFKIILQSDPIDQVFFETRKKQVKEYYKISDKEIEYLCFKGKLSNTAYSLNDPIEILRRDGSVVEFSKASDNSYISYLVDKISKEYICFPKIDYENINSSGN